MSEASLPNMNQTLAGSRVQGPAPAVLGGDVRASRPRARVVHTLCSACCKGASLCFLAVLPQHLSCSLLLSNKGHVMAGRWASCTVWFTGRNQPHFRLRSHHYGLRIVALARAMLPSLGPPGLSTNLWALRA